MVEVVDRVRLSTLDTKNARLSYPSSGASVVHRCTECDRDGIGVVECVLVYGLHVEDVVVDASPFYQILLSRWNSKMRENISL
jgi:hypothetical protein